MAAASHELRSPLTSIIGSLRTLERPDVGADANVRGELLVVARTQAERLFRLVRNMLRGAHIEDGDVVMTFEEADLARLIADAVADLPSASGGSRSSRPRSRGSGPTRSGWRRSCRISWITR